MSDAPRRIRRRSSPCAPARASRSGRRCKDDGVNFAVYSPRATQLVAAPLSRAPADLDADRGDRARRGGPSQLRLLARVRRRCASRLVLHVARRWARTSRRRACVSTRSRELLDPWARLVSDAVWDRDAAVDGDLASALRAEIAAADDYDWEGDRPLRRSLQDAVIYELHVGGFTRHPSSGVADPGTFRGLVDKIPYLQALGITDVELLPVFAFDTQDVPAATAALGLSNFWGYSPVSFFAPHRGVRRRRRSAARVPRPGQGAACGRHRRDPRRRAEPHGRRRRRRADDRLQRARQRAVLSARSGGPSEAISISRAAATP